MESFTIANGTAFRYYDSGKGDKVILLIHGYLESIESWEMIIPSLKKNYRVIALDVPGHGVSEVKGEIHTTEFLADTINGLLEKLNIPSATLMGHSMGGYIAIAFARKYPSKVDNLIMHHSTPDDDTPEKRENRAREIEVIRSGRKELLSTINPGKSFAKKNRKALSDLILEISEQVMMTEDEGIIALLNGMMERGDGNDIIEALSNRVMFIFGRDDEFMPAEYSQTLAERHTKTKTVWMENSGHSSHYEEPEKLVAHIINFVG